MLAPDRFEHQLRTMRRLGYEFVRAVDLGGRPPPARTAVATFDDGWADATDTVAPILERFGIRASFYVCPGWWGGSTRSSAGPPGGCSTRTACARCATRATRSARTP